MEKRERENQVCIKADEENKLSGMENGEKPERRLLWFEM